MSGSPTTTVDTKIDPNEYLNSLYSRAVGEDGQIKWENLGDDAKNPNVQAAIIAEKRRRDTQAAYTKTNQAKIELEKKVEILSANPKPKIEDILTPEQSEMLEKLKFENPDEWYKKVRELEQNIEKEYQKQLDVTTSEVTLQSALDTYNINNPETPIDIETLKLEVPPRLIQEVENGKIGYDEFIVQAGKFIYGEKKIKTETPPNIPNLDKKPGSNIPSDSKKQLSEDYEDTIF